MLEPTIDPDVAAVLTRPYLDYGDPLAVAWDWNRSGDPAQLKKSEQLLAKLTEPDQFDFALPVWYERAFNLVRQKQPERALELLETIGERFENALDEDTLCLWARIYKDRGDAAWATVKLAEAARAYASSEALYQRAYERGEDPFPGINIATLRFIQAGLKKAIAEQPLQEGADATGLDVKTIGRGEAQTLLASARELTATLIANHHKWSNKLPDDVIWRLATLAEAYVLLGKWNEAVQTYHAALAKANHPNSHHADSMKSQLKRILAAYELLGDKPRNLDEFIPAVHP